MKTVCRASIIPQFATRSVVHTESWAESPDSSNLILGKTAAQVANEPSVGMYYVQEHVKNSVPRILATKVGPCASKLSFPLAPAVREDVGSHCRLLFIQCPRRLKSLRRAKRRSTAGARRPQLVFRPPRCCE